MTLIEFRQKYPQYNNLSDQDLADKLYNQYYSDMFKDAFYAKIDFIPENKKYYDFSDLKTSGQ
jgi:hypothetical protein